MAFEAFDHDKKGTISSGNIGTILGMLGHEVPSEELAQIIAEIDMWGKYILLLLRDILKSRLKEKSYFSTIFGCLSKQ